jgi:hypothetical protein
MEAWGTFLEVMTSIREGDGTLLDNTMVFAQSDTQLAKTHSIAGIPIMIAGKAGGRVKTGIHIAGNGDPISRVGLTVQQIMGVSVDRWGTGSMLTSKSIGDLSA